MVCWMSCTMLAVLDLSLSLLQSFLIGNAQSLSTTRPVSADMSACLTPSRQAVDSAASALSQTGITSQAERVIWPWSLRITAPHEPVLLSFIKLASTHASLGQAGSDCSIGFSSGSVQYCDYLQRLAFSFQVFRCSSLSDAS
jgi:hypothetical protein